MPSLISLFATISPRASFLSEMTENTRGLVIAGIILAISIVVGVILERVLIGSIRKFAASTAGKLDDVIAVALKGVARWGIVLIGVYYAIPFLPLPENIDKQITGGFRIAVLVGAVFVAARFASGIAAEYAHRVLPSSVSMAKVVVNIIVFTIGLLVIFQTMGIEIGPMIAALGVGGLAVALALQDTLANFFAGINILATRQIRPGDYIRLDGGQEGIVHDVSWRTTTLRVPNNQYVIVPNTKMAQAIINNFNVTGHALSMPVTVSIAYGSDLARVERVAIEAAREVITRVEGAVPDSQAVVRFHTFTDIGIKFDVVIRVKQFTDQGLLKHELVKAIQSRFAAEGIELPAPLHAAIQRNLGN